MSEIAKGSSLLEGNSSPKMISVSGSDSVDRAVLSNTRDPRFEPHHWCLYYFIYLYHSIFLSIAQKRPKWRKKSQELTVQKTLANLLKQPDHLNSARDEKNWSIFCSWFISSPWASNFMVHEVAKQLFWKTWKRLNAKKSVPRSCRCCLSGARCFCSTRHLVDATVSQLTFYFYLKIRPVQWIRRGGGGGQHCTGGKLSPSFS